MVATLFLGMAACSKSNSSLILGTWGVEKVEYYYVDFYGNPIDETIEAYYYTPGDQNNGIDLVFYSGHHGEWRDRDVDTFLVPISVEPVLYDTIINPDSTVVTQFTYTVDDDLSAIIVKTDDAVTYMLDIEELNKSTFSYTNRYKQDYVEHAILKKIDNSKATRTERKQQQFSRKPGSFLSHRSLNEER